MGTGDKAAEMYALGAQFVNLGGDFGFCMQGLEAKSKELDAAAPGRAAPACDAESGGASKAY